MKLSVLQEQRLQQLTQHLSQHSGIEALLTPNTQLSSGEDATEPSEPSQLTPTLVAIATHDQKPRLLHEVSWIREVQHVAYHYQRSSNSVRVLFSDGVICDFYCYTNQELETVKPINQCEWHLFWHANNTQVKHYPHQSYDDVAATKDALTGELLTMLVLGLRLFSQGQKLAAFSLVQHKALLNLIKLKSILPANQQVSADTQHPWETHAPAFDEYLPQFAAGFTRTPESAMTMLSYVESLMPVNYFIKDQILNLADACQSKP